MIRLIPALFLWLLLPLAAQAQTVQIRSGEHETFTRLTMTLPKRLSYVVEETEQGARISFAAQGLKLDTSVVFDKIPRDRLADLSWQATSQTLELRFGCDCAPTLFWHERSMLVLDLAERDGAARSDPRSAEAPAPKSEGDSTETGTPATMPDQLPKITQSRAVELMMKDMPGASLPQPGDPPLPGLDPETRTRLMRQMSRAASQGLLSPRMDRPKRRMSEENSPVTTPADKAPTNPERSKPDENGHINLKAQSSIDRDFLGSVLPQHRNIAGSGCYSTSQVDVASWGDATSFAEQIAPLRRRLTGEFDEPDPGITADLARRYLFFAFGAEAQGVLRFLPADHADKALLHDLADIAERGFAAPGSTLAGLMDCQSPAALWSALSYAELPHDKPIDKDAILRAFNALPDHLRAYYGPILAQRFLRAGDRVMSDKLLRILDRNPDTLTPQSDLLVAELHSAKGDEDAAEEVLKDVVESNSEPSIAALLQQIEKPFAAGREIPYELAQLAGAYAFEHQNLDDGLALAAAYVRALIASGSVDEAFEEFDRLKSRFAEDEMKKLRSDLLTRLAEQPDDIAFLHHGLRSLNDMSDVLEVEAANMTARRMLSLGFPKEARQLLQADVPEGHRAARERALLRAEQALATGVPRLAIVELLGLTGDDANLLRARARSMVGEHKAAQVLFAAANQPEAAQREAWRGSDWAQARNSEKPVYDQLATLMSNEDSLTDDTTGEAAVLAQNRLLTQSAAEMRATFDALLAAHPTPEPLSE